MADGRQLVSEENLLTRRKPQIATGEDEAYANAHAANPHIAAIGSTDFHTIAPIGLCRTYVFAKTRTRAAILEAIRAGR